MATAFCDILVELIKVIRTTNADFINKTRQIYNRVKTIKVFVFKVQILLF